jgi:hypothetical protein
MDFTLARTLEASGIDIGTNVPNKNLEPKLKCQTIRCVILSLAFSSTRRAHALVFLCRLYRRDCDDRDILATKFAVAKAFLSSCDIPYLVIGYRRSVKIPA